MPGETEKRGAAGRKGGRGFRLVGLSGFRAAEGAGCVLGRPPAGLMRWGLWPPTYRGASCQAGSSCPPALGRLGPRTSSSPWLCGTGWARSDRTRHTRGRTALAAAVAVGPPRPPSPGHVLAPAGSGFSPPLSERQARGTAAVSPPWLTLRAPRPHVRRGTRRCWVATGFCLING